ncbi:MAG: 50S ribosomal protein L4 [Elusimicrobiota bacterium]
MIELEILNPVDGQPTGDKVTVSPEIDDSTPSVALLHEVITAYQANRHQGTHSTLTRGEVRGGGKKPWKQKHTGHARSGSNRSPLWRKGGIVFGPHPRSYRIEVGVAKKRLALAQALRVKLDGQMAIIREDGLAHVDKTKELVKIMTSLTKAPASSQLLVVKKAALKLKLAARNVPWLRLANADQINAEVLLWAKRVVMSEQAWGYLAEVCRRHG